MNPERRIEAVAKAIVDDDYQWNSPDYVWTREEAMFEAMRVLEALDEAEASELVAVRSALRSLVDSLDEVDWVNVSGWRPKYEGFVVAEKAARALLDGLSQNV